MGVDRADLLYKRCHDIWGEHADCSTGRSSEECPAKKCFETGKHQKAFRTRYNNDGTQCQEEVFASPILGDGDHVEQVVEVWRDITERKSQEAQMAEFQRLASMGMLASGFSHEVNTPLGTVLLGAEAIKRRADDSPSSTEMKEIGKQVDLIRNEIQRCSRITKQFLRLSRGKSLSRDPLDLPTIVKETIPLVDHLAREAGVVLKIVESEVTPIVMANSGAAQQVLLNILLNAVQASKPGGEVRVSWHSNSSAVVRIQDDGPGIAPEVLDKVFEPFFSQHPSGTGLGLFVSLNLARQWNGDIVVQSEPGKGATFEVVFPLQAES